MRMPSRLYSPSLLNSHVPLSTYTQSNHCCSPSHWPVRFYMLREGSRGYQSLHPPGPGSQSRSLSLNPAGDLNFSSGVCLSPHQRHPIANKFPRPPPFLPYHCALSPHLHPTPLLPLPSPTHFPSLVPGRRGIKRDKSQEPTIIGSHIQPRDSSTHGCPLAKEILPILCLCDRHRRLPWGLLNSGSRAKLAAARVLLARPANVFFVLFCQVDLSVSSVFFP